MKKRDKYGLVKIVQKLEIFRDLSEEEGLHILGMCQRRAFDAEQIVWRPGDPGTSRTLRQDPRDDNRTTRPPSQPNQRLSGSVGRPTKPLVGPEPQV